MSLHVFDILVMMIVRDWMKFCQL